ncbi:hypothetical protein M2280_005940 [Prescottella agglutinans]|uniref:Uncharacterized protein n=1 Tax=Prescottella agglutinans TaxID=1644129 RepID=A0ABT6MMC3_9NOCA|nr:hypothetical protein [Prescottella agglutinans]
MFDLWSVPLDDQMTGWLFTISYQLWKLGVFPGYPPPP